MPDQNHTKTKIALGAAVVVHWAGVYLTGGDPRFPAARSSLCVTAGACPPDGSLSRDKSARFGAAAPNSSQLLVYS